MKFPITLSFLPIFASVLGSPIPQADKTQPSQIHLALGPDETSMGVQWSASSSDSTVKYRLHGSDDDWMKVQGDDFLFTDGGDGAFKQTHHVARMTGLTPGEKYVGVALAKTSELFEHPVGAVTKHFQGQRAPINSSCFAIHRFASLLVGRSARRYRPYI